MDGRSPPYPGILWTLLKSVPDGIQDLSGFWGTWTRPPSHPEWAPVCPIPCLPRLKVPLLAAIYHHSVGGAVWLCQLGRVPGTLCPWKGGPYPREGGSCPGMGYPVRGGRASYWGVG